MKKGMGKLFASVMRLRTKPGKMVDMPMFFGARSRRRDSPYERMAALLAL